MILFEMLSGVKPFRGKSITEIISFMERRGPEDIAVLNPSVPQSLKQVITKALAFDPALERLGAKAHIPLAEPDRRQLTAASQRINERGPHARRLLLTRSPEGK